jgi:DNA-binding CsgD family transcriptional regulator
MDPAGNASDQRAVSVATVGLLRALTDDGRPVVIAIDDLQWLDGSSAAILAFGLRRTADRPIGLLLSMRGTLPHTDRLNLGREVPLERFETLRVGPLPLAALHRLFMERLGQSFPRLVLFRIEQAANGNPFYALEIARALNRSTRPVNLGEPLPVPESLGATMGERIAALPQNARNLLALAAAGGEPSLDDLERAHGSAVTEELQPAIAEAIVELDRGSVRFTHPLLSQAVLASVEAPRLRAIHATLAATATSDDARARHLGQAADGRDETAAHALAEAAARARSRGASLDASSLYDQASDLAPDSLADLATHWATLAAECVFVDLSDAVASDAILERAIHRARVGPARSHALSLRAIVQYYHGRVPEAVNLCEQALREVGDDRELRARVLVRLSFVAGQLNGQRGLELIREAVDLLEDGPPGIDPDLLANALLLREGAELLTVTGVQTGQVARGLGLITPDGRSWERENADGAAFALARHTDDLDRAIAMTEELIAQKGGEAGDDPFNVVQLSGLHCLRGNWSTARVLAEEGLQAYEREGADVFPEWALRGVALVAAYQGRVEDARRFASQGRDLARASGNMVLETMHCHILGFTALSIGELQEADAQLAAAASIVEKGCPTAHPGRFKIEGDRAEVAIALGNRERAEEVVAWLESAGRLAPTPWTLAVGARCRGSLEAALGNLESAAEAFDRAIVEHENLPMPFEQARTLLAKGQLQRRRKEKRAADQTLREALECFETLGATHWIARARSELGRVGLRPRAGPELSDTELRVAELAAKGLTTREIAEIAFLAPKTVGNVLGRVYAKLSIGSRAELGAVMSRREGSATAPSDRPAPASRHR